jgi:hypothetical protein
MRPSAMCALIISNSRGTGRRPSPRELLLHPLHKVFQLVHLWQA